MRCCSTGQCSPICIVCDNEAISMIYLLNVNEFNLTNQIARKFRDEGTRGGGSMFS